MTNGILRETTILDNDQVSACDNHEPLNLNQIASSVGAYERERLETLHLICRAKTESSDTRAVSNNMVNAIVGLEPDSISKNLPVE